MLHTAQYPLPGSLAVLDGVPVRIHQQLGGDTVLVMGDRITRRVDLAELSPPAEATLFQQWLAERITPAPDASTLTPATEIARDYRTWLAARGHAESWPVSDRVFTRMLRDAGHFATSGFWRAEGERHARTRVLYRLVLQGRLQ